MKKICIVGFGAIGPVHAKAIENINSAELYAVCDINPEKLKAAKTDYPGIKTFESFDEALCCSEIDAFHICTPHYLHFEMIKKALAAEKTVVSEKPVTMTKAEFDALLKLKGAENTCLVFQNRYNPCIKKLFELTQKNEYGKILGINANLMWKRDAAYYNSASWRGTKDMEGGGVLINQAIHTLDLVMAAGGKPTGVSAQKSNLSLKEVIEVEDTVSAVINFENSAKGVFFATNTASADSAPYIEVICEGACIVYRNYKLYLDDELICTDNNSYYTGKKCWGTRHETLLADFYENGSFISPFDAKNTMDTMFAIYESADAGGKEIKIS